MEIKKTIRKLIILDLLNKTDTQKYLLDNQK